MFERFEKCSEAQRAGCAIRLIYSFDTREPLPPYIMPASLTELSTDAELEARAKQRSCYIEGCNLTFGDITCIAIAVAQGLAENSSLKLEGVIEQVVPPDCAWHELSEHAIPLPLLDL